MHCMCTTAGGTAPGALYPQVQPAPGTLYPQVQLVPGALYPLASSSSPPPAAAAAMSPSVDVAAYEWLLCLGANTKPWGTGPSSISLICGEHEWWRKGGGGGGKFESEFENIIYYYNRGPQGIAGPQSHSWRSLPTPRWVDGLTQPSNLPIPTCMSKRWCWTESPIFKLWRPRPLADPYRRCPQSPPSPPLHSPPSRPSLAPPHPPSSPPAPPSKHPISPPPPSPPPHRCM
jgi:hypothetical protein